MNRVQAAEQLRRVLQMFAENLTEEQAMQVAAVFDPWEIGRAYTAGEYLTCGVNSVGDLQLYKVLQDHTAQADWTPKATASLYEAIGLDERGYPVWSQPAGAHDAYKLGDVVNYHGVLYRSEINGNVYAPQAYIGAWTVYMEDIL